MSLNFKFESKPRFLKPMTVTDFISALQNVAMNMQIHIARIKSEQDKFFISVCPNGEFTINFFDGRFSGDVRTSIIGPGYHKYCIEFIEQLKKELRVSITVNDETNYYKNRDFSSLCRQMDDQLKSLFSIYLGRQKMNINIGPYICWNTDDYMPELDEKIVTPNGAFSEAEIKSLVDNNLAALGKLFWTWPNMDKDAYYFRGCALNIMWKDII